MRPRDGEILTGAIVVEVQLRVDPRKLRSWPVYVTREYAHHGQLPEMAVLSALAHGSKRRGAPWRH